MLTLGHLTASYLATKIFLKIIKPELNNNEIDNSLFLLCLSLLLWFCFWIHFGLDSLKDRIRWLWPFNKKFFRVKDIEILPESVSAGFLKQLFHFLKHYTKKFKLTFHLKTVLILAALTLYLF